jgi:hypothetical protein
VPASEIADFVVVAVVGTAVVYARHPAAIARAGSVGPEFVQEDA